MINSILNETCIIKHRQEGTRDSFNQYDYYLEEDVSCLGLEIKSNEKTDDKSINLTDMMTLFLVNEIKAGDKIIYDGFEYDILAAGITKGKDIVSGIIEYYAVLLEKRTAHPPETVEIKRR